MPNILMPALSPTMEEGKLSKWLVKEGDTVNPGDVLAEIETDKATMEVESVDSGKVSKLLIPEGTEGVKVNTPIALVLGEGEAPGETAPVPPAAAPQPSMVTAEAPAQAEAPAPKAPAAAAAPKLEIANDPDLPAGVEMVEMTVRQALNEAMAEEMRRDPDIFLMGEEVAEYQGAYKISQGLLEEFGARRVIDTPITEHGFAGLGVGAAFAGLRPIIEFMTFNFAMQAIDQVINSAAKQLYMSGGQVHAPIVFRGPNGAAARVGAQHSQDYSAWYSHVPGLYVVAPFSAADAKGLLKAAIRSNNPVVFLENEILYGSTGLVPKVDDFVLPIGKARIARPGKDVTIVSYSMGMRYASQATEKLVAQGVDVELIDLRTLRPMDSDTVIASVKKTGRLVTVEEGWPQGSIGSEISARVMEQAFDYLDAPVTRVTGKDVPMPYAANLEKLALPNVDEVIAAVNAVTYRGVMMSGNNPTQDELDAQFLTVAYDEAMRGLREGGIPIGSVLVRNGEIIGRGHNRRVQKGDPILHGEMDAIQNAGRQRTYKDVTCYTTLSPCMMCTGTIIQFGISRVVVAESKNFKGFQDVLALAGVEVHDHHDARCEHMMADFIEKNPSLWNEDIGE